MLNFENLDHIELEYHPESKILEARWLRPLNQVTLANLLHLIVTEANKLMVDNIVLDSTFVHIEREQPRMEDWVQQDNPATFHLLTVRKIAWIRSGDTPYDHEKANHYDTLIKANFPSVQFQSFAHYYEAMYWIK